MFSSQQFSETSRVLPVLRERFLNDGHCDVLAARDACDLSLSFAQFVVSIGFDRYTLLCVTDSSGEGRPQVEWVDNTPPGFFDASRDVEQGSRDPVLQAAKRRSVPFTYGRDAYIEAGVPELWDQQANYGFCCGIVSPFHLPGNLSIIVGVDRYEPLPSDPSELARVVSAFHLFATFAQCAARELFVDRSNGARCLVDVLLSPRERECLQWAAAGKTAWETGMILSIAEGSVAKLLAAATRKLHCTSKAQALVKALKLGFIH
jgi:DNA-binding CsgD family transcriptional regulator